MSRRVVVFALPIVLAVAVAVWRAAGAGGPPQSQVIEPVSSTGSGASAQPRADRPLLWVQPPQDTALDSLRLRASDWNGNDMGTVSLRCLAPCSVDPSPDGQRLLVRPEGMRLVQPPGGGTLEPQPATVFDSSGALVGNVASAPGEFSSAWADDSRHLCVVRNATGPQGSVTAPELDLVDTSSGDRRMVSAAAGPATSAPSATGFQSWNVVACSVTSDRAVLTDAGPDGVGGLVVIRLSDGHVLFSRADQLSATAPRLFPIDDMTVSADGGWAVEHLTADSFRLRDLSSGALIPWPGGPPSQPASVASLSWHGLRAVTDRGVVDLSNGHVTWRPLLATPLSPEQDARPGSDDVVVVVGGNEVVVRSDGTTIGLWGAFRPLGLPCNQLSSMMPVDRVIVLC